MKHSALPFLFLFVLAVAAAITLACGSSSPRTLQSVSITPATANAQDYPDGQVPFTAAGSYTHPPSPVTPISATWGACTTDGSATTAVTVSSNGVAQCASGASGTYQVWAFDMSLIPGTANCNVITACGGGCGRVTGTAQLTCP
jgi:hypothetical protein